MYSVWELFYGVQHDDVPPGTSLGPATAQPPGGHPQRWLILGVICLAQLTVLLDNTVLNVAIPSLTRELDAATSDIQWMINAYSLVQSGLLLTAGSAADRYGRKKMLIAGLALFGAGSLVAGLADSTGQLIAARAGMGVGGALLMTTTLAVAMQIFTPEEQPKAIGIWAAVNSLGFAAGPLLGGFMLDHFWWGAIFLINLPVAALGLVAVVALVPESKNPQGDRPDLLGAVLSTIGMASLVVRDHLRARARLDVRPGPDRRRPSAVVVLAAFAYWESRIPYPMLDMHFFRNRRFTGAVAGGVLITFGMGGLALPAHAAHAVRARLRAPGGRAADGAARPDDRGAELHRCGGEVVGRGSGRPLAIGLGMTVMAGRPRLHRRARLRRLHRHAAGAGAHRRGAAVASPAMVTRDHERDPAGEGGGRRRDQRHGGGVRHRAGRRGARGGAQRPLRRADPGRGGVPAGGAGRGGVGRRRGRGSRTRSPPAWRPVSWWGRWLCCSGGWSRRCCCAGLSGQSPPRGSGASGRRATAGPLWLVAPAAEPHIGTVPRP